MNLTKIAVAVLPLAILWASCSDNQPVVQNEQAKADSTKLLAMFVPPDTSTIPHDAYGDMVRYGRELLINTAYYLGPDGTKGHYLGNKMTCSQCHVNAGTVPFGLNYFSTHARYPQYRGREDRIMTLPERVNNCIERPHNGTPMPLDSKEMVAIVTYMQWLGQGVPVGKRANGDDGAELEYPKRPADITHGAAIFEENCKSCHGKDGEGQMNAENTTYTYPPLWGKYGFEMGSSMHRVLKMARFIKTNMPHGKATWQKPFLTDEECIDVAAFVNDDRIHKRPVKSGLVSYPNYKVKAIDYDEGPYTDSFSAIQHKFGPYQPIIDYHTQHGLPVIF